MLNKLSILQYFYSYDLYVPLSTEAAPAPPKQHFSFDIVLTHYNGVNLIWIRNRSKKVDTIDPVAPLARKSN